MTQKDWKPETGMKQFKRHQLQARKRRKYVNMKKHKHPNASFSELWKEANERYPD